LFYRIRVMGNTQSDPGPPPETNAQRVAREDREAAAALAKQEADDLAADSKARKEYDTQQKQNELEKNKQKRDAERLLRERNDADALNERNGFKKRPLNKPLEIGLPSADCSSCDLTVDSTLSSSTVILTRNVLGAINIPPIPMPPSNLPRGAKYNGHYHDHGGHRHEYYAQDMFGRIISVAKDGSTLYSPPYPGSSYPEVLSSAETEQLPNQAAFAKKWVAQVLEEHKNKQKINAQNALAKKRVYIWNPSEEPWLRGGSHELNWNNHGALTKLYIKPTIPFKVSFDPYGALYKTPTPPPVTKVLGNSKPTLPTPPTGPAVNEPPTL
jgi:hypothetical protein